jgi:hypothetical protein
MKRINILFEKLYQILWIIQNMEKKPPRFHVLSIIETRHLFEGAQLLMYKLAMQFEYLAALTKGGKGIKTAKIGKNLLLALLTSLRKSFPEFRLRLACRKE